MKIKEVEISNFRKLRNKVIIDFQDAILVVGKNNTGKTSVFEVFEKFLTVKKNFKFEDFSAYSISERVINDIYSEYKRIKDGKEAGKLSDEELQTITSAFPCITLKTTILVDEVDNLAVIKELLYEFTNNREIQLVSKYEIQNCKSLISNYCSRYPIMTNC